MKPFRLRRDRHVNGDDLRVVLERAGVEFLPDNGVRLKRGKGR